MIGSSAHAVAARLLCYSQASLRTAVRDGLAESVDSALQVFDPTLLGRVDAIVSVDAAYHARSRLQMLQASHRCLAPKGRLALTDLCVPAVTTGRAGVVARLADAAFAFALGLAGVPTHQLMTIKQYEVALGRVGFVDVAVESTCGSEH